MQLYSNLLKQQMNYSKTGLNKLRCYSIYTNPKSNHQYETTTRFYRFFIYSVFYPMNEHQSLSFSKPLGIVVMLFHNKATCYWRLRLRDDVHRLRYDFDRSRFSTKRQFHFYLFFRSKVE